MNMESKIKLFHYKKNTTFKKKKAVAVLMQLESMKYGAFDVVNLKAEKPQTSIHNCSGSTLSS